MRTACETSMGLQLANLRAKVVSRFNVHDAKSNLSRLLTGVERGEEVTIMRDGEPVADLVPHGSKRAPVGWEHLPAPLCSGRAGTRLTGPPLWAVLAPDKLSAKVRKLLASATFVVSVVSLGES